MDEDSHNTSFILFWMFFYLREIQIPPRPSGGGAAYCSWVSNFSEKFNFNNCKLELICQKFMFVKILVYYNYYY